MNEQDKSLLEETKNNFEHSIKQLDAETSSKITQARYRALERANNKTFSLTKWLPVGAVATTCLALVIFMSLPKQTDDNQLFEEDLDLISASEELDLYEELEFYQWLENYELPS